MAAIVGAAGLRSTLAAARAGKRLLLANKESLVMAGPLLMQTVRDAGATLLPIDSEHNAVFQCLPPNARSGEAPPGVKRILLTASAGRSSIRIARGSSASRPMRPARIRTGSWAARSRWTPRRS